MKKKSDYYHYFLGIMVFLAGCDYSKPEETWWVFYNTFLRSNENVLVGWEDNIKQQLWFSYYCPCIE